MRGIPKLHTYTEYAARIIKGILYRIKEKRRKK